MKRIPILITLILFLGCQPVEVQEFEPEPNVFALMRVGADYQLVKVERTASMTDTVGDWGTPDAEVYINGSKLPHYADTSAVDTFRSWSIGEYVTGMDLDDTTLYSLDVYLPWGDTVIADAYMPSSITISFPVDSDTVSIGQQGYDPTVIAWNKCSNTELYIIYCTPDVPYEELEEYPFILFLPAVTGDTSYALFNERMVFPWVTDMQYVLRVEAVSPEYYNYLGFNPQGSISNLSAGYGVFGGVAVDSIRIYIAP